MNWRRETRLQRWCPNCDRFRKNRVEDNFLNACDLTGWTRYPLNGGRPDVVEWQKENWDCATNVREGADDCPGFVPYAALAQRFYSEHLQNKKEEEDTNGRNPTR